MTAKQERRLGMTMKQAQRQCRRWREEGDVVSIKRADKLEAAFKSHSQYESDLALFMRIQAGPSR